MSEQHTAGTWSTGVERDGYTHINGDGWDELALVVTRMADDKPCAEGVANARRICAAVNACVGIPTTVLEAAARDGKFLHVYQMLLRQHDELLDAARAAEAVLGRQQWRQDSPDPEAVALRLLRAAIARADGEVTQ